MERVILPDCCEDWILAYGAFFQPGAEFECIECGTPWRKLEPGRFQETRSGRVWAERARAAEGQRFPYLEAETGEAALTNRCCAKLILGHGDRMETGKRFTCPMCGSGWEKQLVEHRSGLQVAGYRNMARGVTIAVQKGARRDYLVPLEEFRPPRD